MNVEILDEAQQDLMEGFRFYESQSRGLGDYFVDSLFSDIDSLQIYAGIHSVHLGYYRLGPSPPAGRAASMRRNGSTTQRFAEKDKGRGKETERGSASMIEFACPKCRRVFQGPDEDAGRKVRCQSCGCVMLIPSPASGTAGAGESGVLYGRDIREAELGAFLERRH